MKRKLGFIFTSILLISLGTLVVIAFNTRADQNVLAQITFFIFCFFTLSSFSILIPLTYQTFKHRQITQLFLKIAARRAVLISAAITGILVFSALHVLNVLSALTFIFSLFLTELFFVARKIEQKNEN